MNDIIDMNMPQRFNLGKIVSDTTTTLDAAMKLVGRHKDDEHTFKVVVEYLKVYSIGARKLSNGIVVVYWIDDTRVDDILNANLAELPEFLTDEEYEVRLLAVHRLAELNE